MKNPDITKTVLFSLLVLLTQCIQESEQKGTAIELTILNSLQRALPGLPFNGKPVADIKAAKNEYEAFQLIISTGTDNKLENVKVEITDLEGDNGLIGKEHLELFRIEDIHVRKPSPRSAYGPGLFPDPLLPFIDPVSGDSTTALQRIDLPDGSTFEGAQYSAYPISLFPGQHCSIWVDVFVPPDAQAGIYKGEIKVKADGNISSTVTITLKVWDFTLPDIATHSTHLGHFSLISRIWDVDRESEEFKEIELRFCKEMAKHRINPPIPHSLLPEVNEDGSITIIPEKHEKLVKYVEQTNLVDFEVPRTPFMSNTSNSTRPTPENQTDPVAIEKSIRYYREMYQYLKDNGWDERAYLYMIDEPNSVKDYNQVINLAKAAEEGAPDLQRLVVEQTYKHEPSWPDLDESIDIWCSLFGFIDRETIQEKIANGDQVWSYSALVQPAPSYHPDYDEVKDKNPPYWHIDQPVIAYRIPAWINRQYDITGLLYWTTSGWYDEHGPWLVPGFVHYSQIDENRYEARYYNGGGMLFYPGINAGFDGPVTTIRLKNIREGLEDYEYFAILEAKGEGDFVKEMVNAVCPEWWDYTEDPETLLKIREQLALKIESLKE
jgi:hypothetical protein